MKLLDEIAYTYVIYIEIRYIESNNIPEKILWTIYSSQRMAGSILSYGLLIYLFEIWTNNNGTQKATT